VAAAASTHTHARASEKQSHCANDSRQRLSPAGTNSAVLSAFEVSYNIVLHQSTVIIIIIIIIIIYFYTPGSKDPRGVKN